MEHNQVLAFPSKPTLPLPGGTRSVLVPVLSTQILILKFKSINKLGFFFSPNLGYRCYITMAYMTSKSNLPNTLLGHNALVILRPQQTVGGKPAPC